VIYDRFMSTNLAVTYHCTAVDKSGICDHRIIRMSLGASRSDVLRMVVRQGMMQALAGTVTGVAGALLLSQLMGKMLYGVRPTDPATFGAVGIILGVAALLAICVPARKATMIEPVIALRQD